MIMKITNDQFQILQKMAHKLIWKMNPPSRDREDIYQDCLVAILEREKGYDKNKGGLTTYFYPYLKQAIRESIIKNEGGSPYIGKKLQQLKKAYWGKESNLYTDSFATIAANAGLSKKVIPYLINAKSVSVDTDNITVSHNGFENDVVSKQGMPKVMAIVKKQLSKLNARELNFLCDKYGLNTSKLSTKELTQKYGFSSTEETYTYSRKIKQKIRFTD